MFKRFIRNLIILLLVGVVLGGFGAMGVRSLFPLSYQEQILENAKANQLDPNLVCAVIKAESNFDETALSSKGAIGLMQVTEETGQWCAQKMGIAEFDPKTLYDPEINIKIGCWYLAYLLEHFGSVDCAVAAYNGGMNNVKKWSQQEIIDLDNMDVEKIPFPETKNYVKKVTRFLKVYEMLYHLET